MKIIDKTPLLDEKGNLFREGVTMKTTILTSMAIAIAATWGAVVSATEPVVSMAQRPVYVGGGWSYPYQYASTEAEGFFRGLAALARGAGEFNEDDELVARAMTA